MAQPSFSKSFSPSTIGPGSASELIFVIDNSGSGAPVTDLAFTDNLPAALTIADPAFAMDGCSGTLDAPPGGTTITFSGGSIGGNATCQITVDVTGTTLGSHQNTSGDLTSSAGNSGSAVATLTIAADRPGFSKNFAPSMVQFGGKSTLTFTVDNSQNGGSESGLAFTDEFPPGLEIASPANPVNQCNGTLTATAGSTTISYLGGFVTANSSCTISVDVHATAAGRLDNRTSDLTFFGGINSGKASNSIEVVVDELALTKSFIDDPVAPGGTAILEFSITNLDRTETVTDITFTDDLDATLSGLVATGLPANDVCGAGSSLSGTSLLTLTDATLPPGENCTFRVPLQVPAGATPGSFSNTTSMISGNDSTGTVLGSAATDTLFVDVFPVLTKTFLNGPVGAGSTADVEFTITNTSSSFSATDISFFDNLSDFLVGSTPVGLPIAACNGTLVERSNFPSFGAVSLFLGSGSGSTPGSLGPGESCSFIVTLQISAGTSAGTFTNTTSQVTATVDGETRTGPPASDTLDVVGTPRLTKSFTDDPVDPSATVTLQFTLTHSEFAPAGATNIAFTDDLNATLAGLAATGLPQTDICGTGSQLAGDPDALNLSFTGGSLSPGESCTFSVTLQVPPGAPPGFHTNTTSDITATVDGLATIGLPASDDLLISAVELAKLFIGDPVLPGASLPLRFTITNDNPDFEATGISFTDDLNEALPGLAATGLPQNDVCGAGSQISGTSSLSFTGGTLAAGASCTFDVTVQVPAGTASNTYFNVTSPVTATLDGSTIAFNNAQDDLVVDANLLELTKEFTDDPGIPGGAVTLEFTLTNTATEAVSNIDFTDDLDAVFAGLVSESGTQMDICGAGSQLAGTSVLSLTGASLAAGEACTFSATLRIPAGASGNALNTTSAVTGDAGGLTVEGIAASDTLRVNNVAFSKAFSGPTTAAGTVTLTFVLDNLDTANGVSGLSFSDDLDAVIPGLTATGTPLAGVCGAGSEFGGTSVLTLTGGNLGPGESCAFGVVLQVPASAEPGSFVNTTSELLTNGLLAANPASALLQIEPPPAFTKVFDPAAIPATGATALVFTIDNSASSLPATDLTFTDDLPADVVVAATPDATTDCSGATLTAGGGATSINFSGGSLAAGATCTLSVDITSDTPGSYTNVSGALTSSLGDSGTATAELTVTGGEFTLSKVFSDPVLPGGTVDLRFTLVTAAVTGVTGITFTDDLGAVLPGLTAVGLPADGFCGAGSQITGTSILTVTGAEVPAGSDCTFSVILSVPADAPLGTHTNTTSTVSGERLSDGLPTTADPAAATLEVVTLDFTKTLAPSVTAHDSTVTATFTIANPDSANAVSVLAFSDDLDAFVPGMIATNTPIADPCGAGSQLSGTDTITLTSGSLAGDGSCTFQVTLNVPAGASGDFTNTTSLLTGEVDGNQISVAAASAALSVEPPPTFTKAFLPDTIGVDGVSTLSFTIDNADSLIDANDLAFTDPLPAGTVVASMPNAGNTCGGTLTATADGGTIQLSGGNVPAGGSCSVSVDVTSSADGSYTNVSDSLTSTSGDSGSASAVLQVADTEFNVSKAFSSQPVIPGGLVDLEITIGNSSGFALNDIALSDNLDAALTGLVAEGLPLADVCGTGSELTGSSVVNLSGGNLAAGDSCVISISVRVPADAPSGTYANTTGAATGTREGVTVQGPTASADLVVETLGFDKTIAPLNVAAGSTIDITFVISNPDPVNSAEGLTFSDDLDAFVPGMTSSDTPQPDVCGAGSLLDGTAVIELSGGIVPPSGSCTISVTANVPADITAGDYTNQTSALSGQSGGSAFTSASASAPLGVLGAPGFSKVFSPEQVGPDQTSTLIFTIDNSASTFDADSLAFVDPLPTGMRVASEPNVSNSCGGTLSAAADAETISLTDGSVAAASQCTISVDVISSVAGSLTNTTEDLTSSLGNSGSASASITQSIAVSTINHYWMLVLAMLLMLATWLHTRKH